MDNINNQLTAKEQREEFHIQLLAKQKFMIIRAKQLLSIEEWEEIHQKDHFDELELKQELIEAAGLDYSEYWKF